MTSRNCMTIPSEEYEDVTVSKIPYDVTVYKIPYDADDLEEDNWMSDMEEKVDLEDKANDDEVEQEEFENFQKKHKQLIIIGIGILSMLIILVVTNCLSIFIGFNSLTKVDDDKDDKKDNTSKKKESESKKSSKTSKKKSKPTEKTRLKRPVLSSSDSE